MMNPPFSIRAEKAGLKSIDTAAAALGAYQGSSAFVLRTWGAANADALTKYVQAYVEGLRWMLKPENKSEAVALLAERLKLPQDIAALAFDATLKGFNPDGALNMEGFRNVLKLRAQFEGGTPAAPGEIHRSGLLSEGDGGVVGSVLVLRCSAEGRASEGWPQTRSAPPQCVEDARKRANGLRDAAFGRSSP